MKRTSMLIDNTTGGGIPVQVETERHDDRIHITIKHSNLSMTLVMDADEVVDERMIDDGR